MILGLGNPGTRYELTRHNMGFMVLDTFSKKHCIALDSNGYYCHYGIGEINGSRVVLGKPATYMNESGKAMKAILSGLNILPEETIVVHDDIDFPLGKIKTKHQGGDAGQRGIRSIIQKLRSQQFSRVRVGIGRPKDREDNVDYVLSPFLEEEWPLVNEVVEQAAGKVEEILIAFKNKKNQPEEETE